MSALIILTILSPSRNILTVINNNSFIPLNKSLILVTIYLFIYRASRKWIAAYKSEILHYIYIYIVLRNLI